MNKIVKDAQQKLEEARAEILKALEEELNKAEKSEKVEKCDKQCTANKEKKTAPRNIINISYKMKNDNDTLDGEPMVVYGDNVSDAEAILAISGAMATVIRRGLENEISYEDVFDAVSAAMPNVFMNIMTSVVASASKGKKHKSALDRIFDEILGGM